MSSSIHRTEILPRQNRRRRRVRRFALLTLCGTCFAFIYAQLSELPVAKTTLAPQPRAGDKVTETSCALADASTTRASNDLFLSGVLANSNPELGYALLGTPGSSIALYRVGDLIQNRTRLCAVYTNSVLLETDGAIHALHLTQNINIEMDSSPADEPDEAEANFPGRPVKLPAPGPLRDTMQYSEMRVAGNLRAIQVSPSRDLQPLLQLGLWPGDLIIAINGTPVELLSSAEHAINLLGTSKEGQVTIVRNGSRQDITLHREVEPRGPF